MTENTKLNNSSPYTVTEAPLTDADIAKLRKTMAGAYKLNLLLVPLLMLLFFWGLLYFGIFAVFVIGCNVIFTKNYKTTEQQLTMPKIVFTGLVTRLSGGEEMITHFGTETLDITYANVLFEIKVNDLVSVHYSKNSNNSKGQILDVVKEG